MSLSQYLRQALEFRSRKQTSPFTSSLALKEAAVDLEMHHNIEERYIFPVLAQRMSVFGDNAKHRNAHAIIHEGMNRLSALVGRYQRDPTIYSPVEIRDCLDSFKEVLVSHLAEEEKDLSGENMKQYYTLEEVDRLPM